MAWQIHFDRARILCDPMTDKPKLFPTKEAAQSFAELSQFRAVVFKEVK